MGKYGEQVGAGVGSGLGYLFGGKDKERNQDWQTTGKTFGRWLGKLSGYKVGGIIAHTGPANVHKNEFMLPRGVKPTKAQVKAVKRRGGNVKGYV